MKSWSNYIPVLCFAIGVVAFATSIYVYTRGFQPAASGVGEFGAPPSFIGPADAVVDSSIARAAPSTVRPDGLSELSVVGPGDILMVDQRASLARHLDAIRLAMNVPDAMSYSSRREGTLDVLAAASGRDSGFYLFSERRSTRLTTGARKFLVEYFKDSFKLTPDARDEEFRSRFAGRMNWIRGSSATGQRFDAFVIAGVKKTDFSHLLFIFDPTVANATRRLMVDSVRLRSGGAAAAGGSVAAGAAAATAAAGRSVRRPARARR